MTRAREKARRAAPSAQDLQKEAGARIEYKPDGSWVAHVPREHIKRGVEMMKGVRQAKLERDRSVMSRAEGNKEKVVRRDGKVVAIASEHVDVFKDKKGLRPVGRNGVSGRLFFGLSEAAKKYVRGLDELDFVWNDGWEPAPLFSRGASGSQRDPDGNVWRKSDESGEWELEA